jgi:serine/threonine protein kinase
MPLSPDGVPSPGVDVGGARAHRRLSIPNDDDAFRERVAAALGDSYELREIIGQGGFGRVYVALDRRLDRRVAVKVIRPDLAGATAFIERFRREGIALARLRHPGIVPIYDIREHEGLIFYVMPYLAGETLQRWLDARGAQPPKVAHRILLDLCDAVTATHRAGIVHRDIKPSNIILEGRQNKVLLMDFGIAKVVDEIDANTGDLAIGTPTYMSPEQLGSSVMIDARSDIYSLGVVAYHMLAGRPPFSGGSPAEVMQHHLVTRPTPIRHINPSVPMLLADVVEQCLEKDPLDRFESASELWDQLQHVTFFTTPEWKPTESTPVVGRNTYLFAMLALLAVWFGAFGVGALGALRTSEFFLLAGAFAIIAIAASPIMTGAQVKSWRFESMRRWFTQLQGTNKDASS